MPIQIKYEDDSLKVGGAEDIDSLRKTCYGTLREGTLNLSPEEALYLIDVRNAKCFDKGGNELSFNDVAEQFIRPKFLARYMTYKDWRERGLIIRPIEEAKGPYKKNPIKKYPSQEFKPPSYAIDGLFFAEDRLTIVDNPAIGKEVYEKYWLGQYGSYKAEERGRLLKFDPFETLFTVKYCGLKIRNYNEQQLLDALKKENPDFKAMYDVYEDWRLRGFVLKTGFKFGTHFRIYFPGASPVKKGEWVHSKHVIHVFPRTKRMIIAEWARAIRVAHSVRKTFILAIPGRKTKPTSVRLDFLLYHRKQGGGIESPDKDTPSYVMLSLSEEELLGGAELADAIEEAKGLGLDLMLAISDRETGITHYHVKRIELPGSKYQYYEIGWAQP